MRHSHLKSFAQKQCAEGVSVGSVHLRQPVLTASGTAGHSSELNHYFNMSQIGATVVKSLFATPWPGNPAPRVHPTPAGMINAVGLQGPGMAEWIAKDLPECEKHGVTVVASIWGRTVEEYRQAAEMLAPVAHRIMALEVNLSCPNLEGRSGIIAHDPSLAGQMVSAVCARSQVPVWAKLSANTDRIVEVATTVSDAGANAVTVMNTMLGMQIDVRTSRRSLGNGGGGLSGPAIRPIAVRAVHDVRVALPGIAIVGVGGIASGDDAIEMMMAGANAVQVGTASFARPNATWRIACSAATRAHALGASSWSSIVSAVHEV